MIEADSVLTRHDDSRPKIHPDDEIERQLFALITDHMAEPGPAVLWLSDQIASHAIVTRLRIVPAHSLKGGAA